MTQDEIIRMAREAGLVDMRNWLNVYADSYHLERFAALVAAHEREKLHNKIATLQCDIEEMYSRADVDYLIGVEREACAKVCEELQNKAEAVAKCFDATAEECAAAIRARNEK